MKKTKNSELKSGLVEEDDVARATLKKISRFKNRGQYRIVESDSQNIMPSSTETRTEDQILSPSKRGRLLDIVRNLVRNSSLFSTILGQLTTNVVSTCGGKVVLSLPNQQANKDLRKNFSIWTRNVDFNTCDNMNTLLKRVLREYVIGGDVVLIYDDGLIEDSGKVMMFESNEIVDVAPEVVEAHYGKGAWSSQGKVYNKNGRHIGTIVSKSQRDKFDGIMANPDSCYFLKRDPNNSPLDGYWYHFSNNWREGRGVTPASSAVSTIHQLEDLTTSEILSSRLSSQIFCWLVKKNDKKEDINDPNPFPEDIDFGNITQEQLEEMIKDARKDDLNNVFSMRRAKESSVAFEQLPEGFESQQVQTLHPNNNIQTMVEFLSARCAATLGLSRAFVTGSPTDDDFRANTLFSFPAILEFQKQLEQICDWVFYRWLKWAQKKSIVKSYISEDVMEGVDWEWKKIDSLDPVAHQTGIRLALENNTLSYREILGNDWQEKLTQIAEEHKWMLEHNITPPSEKMISGGQTESSKKSTDTSSSTVEEEEIVNN